MRTTSVLMLILILTGCESMPWRGAMPDEVMPMDSNCVGAASAPNAMIFVADGCPLYVRDKAGGGTGPAASWCGKTSSADRSDAVCRHPGDKIIWQLNGAGDFKIDFKGPPPSWKDDCDKVGKRYCCKIDDKETKGKEYAYKVTITTSTPDCVLDPRIIIN